MEIQWKSEYKQILELEQENNITCIKYNNKNGIENGFKITIKEAYNDNQVGFQYITLYQRGKVEKIQLKFNQRKNIAFYS